MCILNQSTNYKFNLKPAWFTYYNNQLIKRIGSKYIQRGQFQEPIDHMYSCNHVIKEIHEIFKPIIVKMSICVCICNFENVSRHSQSTRVVK